MVSFTEPAFKCICGNDSEYMGFSPCLRDGTVVEAVAAKNWKGVSLLCEKCGGIHKNPNFSEDDKPLLREVAA